LAFDVRYAHAAGQFWSALLLQFGLAWVCLGAASRILPRAWHDLPLTNEAAPTGLHWLRRFARASDPLGVPRRLLLEENPILWFAAAGRRSRVLLGTILAAVGLLA